MRNGRRKPDAYLREALNAIRCMARTGGGWRMLPKDFPPWQTVHRQFRRFARPMPFRALHDLAVFRKHRERNRRLSPQGSAIGASPALATAGSEAACKTHLTNGSKRSGMLLPSSPSLCKSPYDACSWSRRSAI